MIEVKLSFGHKTYVCVLCGQSGSKEKISEHAKDLPVAPSGLMGGRLRDTHPYVLYERDSNPDAVVYARYFFAQDSTVLLRRRERPKRHELCVELYVSCLSSGARSFTSMPYSIFRLWVEGTQEERIQTGLIQMPYERLAPKPSPEPGFFDRFKLRVLG